MIPYLFSKKLLSRTCLVDECFCNLVILLFSQLVYCLLEINSILFLSVVDLSGKFPMVSNHLWVKGWVKPSLSLRLITEIVMLPKIYFFKSFTCIPVWKSIRGAHGRSFYFSRYSDVQQHLRCALKIFYSGHSDYILVWKYSIGF